MILTVGLVAGCGAPRTYTEADFGAEPTPIRAAQLAKNHLNIILKDPESARTEHFFGPVKHVVSFIGPGYAYCLVVNAKNSMGGYTGRKVYLFLIKNDRVIHHESPSVSRDIPIAYNCELVMKKNQ
jgi:hypothetical protein